MAEDSAARNERQSRRTIYGVLLILALVAGAVLIFMLDRIISSFSEEYQLVAVVRDAPGIVEGSPVWIGGKEVGSVTSLGFMPSGQDTIARLALTLRLPARLQTQVRADSRVRLTSARLIGERVVDILPGSATAPVLAPGDTLRQRPYWTVDQLTARAATVRADLDTVLVEVREIAPEIGVALERTRVALSGMGVAMQEAQRLQADLQSSPGAALLGNAEFMASLQRAREHLSGLPDMLAQLEERAAPMNEVGTAVAGLRLRADSLRLQLALVAEMVADPNSSAARFRQDTALVRALNAARMELDSLIADVKRNPLRFVF